MGAVMVDRIARMRAVASVASVSAQAGAPVACRASLALASLLSAACGQKGPLTLPSRRAAAPRRRAASAPAAMMRLPGAPVRRLAAATSSRLEGLRAGRPRARASARRCTSTRAARCARARRLPARTRAAATHLICYAMKANSTLAVLQIFADAGLRLRHRLGRRARARAGGRRRPGARSSSPASARRAPRCAARSTPACCCFNVESEAELRVLSRRGRADAAHARRSACASIPTSTRRPTPTSRPACSGNKFGIAHERGAGGLPARRGAARPRGGRHRLPHRLADHRGRALPRRARPPARPGRGDRGAKASDLPHIDLGGGLGITYTDETPPAADALIARAARAHRRARPRPPRAADRTGPLAGRQRRRAADRGARTSSPARRRTSASSTRR